MSLDEEEQTAMKDLLACTDRVMAWGLRANHDELIAATHVIQGFIVQHMLQRQDPEMWSEWYRKEEA